ncbi:MAG: hypothetical protein KKE12_15680, partial [Proteobacteria bacterium]|nr:hypothetical protein [Pseudomonadota bacterium]
DNFEYFKLNPKGKALKPQIPLPVRYVKIRLDKIEKALNTDHKEIAQKDKFDTLKDNLVEQISELPLSVNIVARQAHLIKQAQTKQFWVNATDQDLDTLSEGLAPLMKFRQSLGQPIDKARFDFLDIVNTKEMVEFGPEHEAVSIAAYREMVEQMIFNMIDKNPILQKIKNNQVVSEHEVRELARTLHEEHPHITEELLQKAYQNRRATFIQFIRHILGLEILESFPETVAKTFDRFIQTHTDLDTRQLDFLNLLREFVLERETVQKKDLIQSPFTIIHPQGIRGLFSLKQIEEIIQLTQNFAA